MAIILDGTSGATLPVPLAVAQGGTGSTTLTLTSPVIAGTPTGVGVLTSSTAVASTSGTSIDFTGIPSWAKRITVMFSGVSSSGTSNQFIQVGSGSVQATGYANYSVFLGNAALAGVYYTTGFALNKNTNTGIVNGSVQLSLLGSNIWALQGGAALNSAAYGCSSYGTVTVTGTLDRIRITFVNGTDTFTAGSINILYE